MAKPHLLNVYIFDVLNNTRHVYDKKQGWLLMWKD